MVAGLKAYSKIVEKDNSITVETLHGVWKETEGNKKSVMLYKLKIDTEGWKKSQIDYVKRLIKTSQEEYKKDKKRKHFLFFIGKQNKDETSEIIVKEPSFISCIEKEN